MNKSSAFNCERAQSSIMFALLIPLFVIGMVFAVDFGRFLVLQNQAQILADGAATAGASALDVRRFTSSKDIAINEPWAKVRAENIFIDINAGVDPTLSGMSFSLSKFDVVGNEVFVQVTGSCATMWSKPFGVPGYVAVANSSARAATGIDREMP